jgi:hypothetical protein
LPAIIEFFRKKTSTGYEIQPAAVSSVVIRVGFISENRHIAQVKDGAIRPDSAPVSIRGVADEGRVGNISRCR